MSVVLLLYLAHGLATLYGYDRLPRASSTDEVLMQDPALSWARGSGLRSPGFDDTLLGRLYAHHPPVFTLVQVVTFKAIGVSAFSMRIWGLIAHLLAALALLSICHALWRRRIMDTAATIMVTLLIVTEPIWWSLARWGRMDPVAIFLGVAAAWVLIAIDRERPARWQWTTSAVLVGLSFSTHLFSVVYYAAFLVTLYFGRRLIEVRVALWLAALPGVTFGLLWIAVFQDRSFEAFEQVRLLKEVQIKPGFNWEGYFDAIRDRDARAFMQRGGSLLPVVVMCVLVLASRCAGLARGGRRAWTADPNHQWIAGFSVWAILMLVFILTASDMSLKRASVVFPILVVALGVSVSHLPNAGVRTAVGLLLGSVIAIQLAMSVLYVAKTHREWVGRDPRHHSAIIRSLPEDKRIAGVPAFWLAAMEQGRAYRLIDFGFAPDRDFWRANPDALTRYDIVLLPEAHPLIGNQILAGWERQMEVLQGIRYVVFEKR